MFCCMIFGMPSAHGSLPVAPVCPIAVNPIMRSGAGGLTSNRGPDELIVIVGFEAYLSISGGLAVGANLTA
jgi:hypothetical protein